MDPFPIDQKSNSRNQMAVDKFSEEAVVSRPVSNKKTNQISFKVTLEDIANSKL